jgi:hypothetical protein
VKIGVLADHEEVVPSRFRLDQLVRLALGLHDLPDHPALLAALLKAAFEATQGCFRLFELHLVAVLFVSHAADTDGGRGGDVRPVEHRNAGELAPEAPGDAQRQLLRSSACRGRIKRNQDATQHRPFSSTA